MLLGKPVVGLATRNDTNLEASCKDSEQPADCLAFSPWGVFEGSVDRDCKHRWLILRNVISEKAGGREQVLEICMSLIEIQDEIGGESSHIATIAVSDLEDRRAKPVGVA